MKVTYKIITSILFILVVCASANAQVLDPVNWSGTSTKINESQYEINIKATIEDSWHLYSQHLEGDEGPLPTEFTITGNGIKLINSVTEDKGIEGFDPTFEMQIKYFEKNAVFKQKIQLEENYTDPITVTVLYMVCNEERCLPPEEKTIIINLKTQSSINAVVPSLKVTKKDLELSKKLSLPLKNIDKLEVPSSQKPSLWKLFFLGFIGGLIALLTPCVFPMIPLTVSFFSHSSKNQKEGIFKAILYGFFIFTVYILVSIPFHVLDSVNPDMLNNVSTNVWLNLIFFIVFVLFAISFFGYFEITLPSKWSNAMDSKANKLGGILGVFFMALTLTLVSFSCTGPILGSLLGGSLSNDGGAMQLTYGMAGFGLALALPFAFFALFPNLLKKLPKSGGWMTTVKVVLGFIELAFAIKFLSNADLVAHWGILKREVFIGLWILIFSGLAAYLFGIFRFPHDSPNQKINTTRKFLGIINIIFVIYLITGLLPNKKGNLQLLSGFPPPTFYSIYKNEGHGIQSNVYTNFEDGIAAAKKQNKPILIDFTGWACVNCRKMEEQVWSTPEVEQLLKNDVILISLYVDDRKSLPIDEHFIFNYPNTTKTKKIKTIGDKWATFQTINFKNNSQPYYVLINSNYKLLQKPIGYTSNAKKYYEWLKKGVELHKKNN